MKDHFSSGEAPELENELLQSFKNYEDALVNNDVAAMNALFCSDQDVVRFGVAEEQWSGDEVATWRASASPIPPGRTQLERKITWCGPTTAVISITFRYPGIDLLGRQSQVWVQGSEGWKIRAAHVSHRGISETE